MLKMELSPGTKLNKYKIIRTLGHGGFAFTYEAVNEAIGLRVCIKELDECGADEGKVLSSLNCENVVRVLDYFEENEKNYLVLEYLDGQTLGQYVLENGKIEPDKLFNLSKQLLGALEEIHGKGLIHRDIAPDNIMVVSEKEGDIKNAELKLFDFGTARSMDKGNYTSVLKDGFTPIEQLAGEKNQGAYTDIYALCAVLYYCMTGKKPESAYGRLLDDSLKKPSELGIEIDPRAEKILMKGLSIKPEDRYQTATEMLSDVEAVLPTKKKADNPSENQNSRKKKRYILVCAALIFVCALAAVIYGFVSEKPLEYDENTMYKITLTPNDEFTVAGYNESIKTLEERLKLFAKNSGEYSLTENGGTITLLLNKSDFPQNEISDDNFNYKTVEQDACPEYILRAYLTRAISLELKVGSFDEGIKLDQTKDITVTKADSESGYKLDVSFSDEFLNENREELEGLGDSYSLIQDAEEFLPITPYTTEPKGDGSGFYIFSEDDESLSELLIYNLTHEPLEQSFNFWIEEQTAWQSDVAEFGENQVNKAELSDDSVSYIVSGLMTDGEMFDSFAVLRKRLDNLDIKYSLGETDAFSCVNKVCDAAVYSYITVSSDDAKLSYSDIANLVLCGGDFRLYSETGEYSEDKVSYSKSLNNNEITVSDYAFAKSLSDKKEKIYLTCGGTDDSAVLMVGEYDEENECFAFSEFANGDKVNEENAWVLSLINVCINNQLPTNLGAYDVQSDNDNNLENIEKLGLFEDE